MIEAQKQVLRKRRRSKGMSVTLSKQKHNKIQSIYTSSNINQEKNNNLSTNSNNKPLIQFNSTSTQLLKQHPQCLIQQFFQKSTQKSLMINQSQKLQQQINKLRMEIYHARTKISQINYFQNKKDDSELFKSKEIFDKKIRPNSPQLPRPEELRSMVYSMRHGKRFNSDNRTIEKVCSTVGTTQNLKPKSQQNFSIFLKKAKKQSKTRPKSKQIKNSFTLQVPDHKRSINISTIDMKPKKSKNSQIRKSFALNNSSTSNNKQKLRINNFQNVMDFTNLFDHQYIKFNQYKKDDKKLKKNGKTKKQISSMNKTDKNKIKSVKSKRK